MSTTSPARSGAPDRESRITEGDCDLDAFVGDAEVLTDDHAPVDQLLTPYERP